MALRTWLNDISLPVYILVMCFAISSWIDINGLMVELPLFVERLPEGWGLPSYLVMMIQLANIGPLSYTILARKWPKKIKEWPFVYAIIAVGIFSCFLLIFFWDWTVFVYGAQRSIGLMVFTFLLAVVDTTSSVVYLPYMHIFKPQYMSGFYLGEGLSGLLPGMLGLVQVIGRNKAPACDNISMISSDIQLNSNTSDLELELMTLSEKHLGRELFSIEIFILFLFLLLVLSLISFSVINFSSFSKREWMKKGKIYDIPVYNDKFRMKKMEVDQSTNLLEQDTGGELLRLTDIGKDENIIMEEKCMEKHQDEILLKKSEILRNQPDINNPNKGHDSQNLEIKDNHQHAANSKDVLSCEEKAENINVVSKEEMVYKHQLALTKFEVKLLLVLTFWINSITNGIVPSILSYSCLPYGPMIYTITTCLQKISNPCASACALFIPLPRIRSVILLTVLGSISAVYLIILALLSPDPPLKVYVVGGVIVISSATLLTATLTYSKVTIASILREHGGRMSLLACGATSQLGSFIGAMMAFIAVNVLHLFEEMDDRHPCSGI